ncbi:peptidoglycan editing factor PgeF [Vibrio hippocampi]|uniref:Purine nucleoside phosphorylase n=1 Tax=Vibrio hippocampi TaxID=654686 RepID=A0ABN8DM84_9VIBR|nr:peptidoglycan editing factor PgeF [Vibrio hippocampi]CAH0527027.1 Polyphenol oxidase [Vibrio hippocampi]
MPFFKPDWKTAAQVTAISSTRNGGVSKPPFDSMNLGNHVGDDPDKVMQNRRRLQRVANMPSAPIWLNQTHSTHVEVLTQSTVQVIDADATYTEVPNLVLSVMTADCLPILIAAKDGSAVAAVHAGWRGLADGIVENTLSLFKSEVQAWIGPAIGADAFEVGDDVKQAFCYSAPELASAFKTHPAHHDKWLADLPRIAAYKLNKLGVEAVEFSGHCTYSEPEQFFSYRRDGVTGRIASFIWLTD